MPKGVNQYTRTNGIPYVGPRGALPTHGLSRTSTYHVWQAMKARCMNPRNNRFYRYGGRGIRVCERWLTFENFLADMGERPVGMTLDRKNSALNYEPSNCRWATQTAQQRNRTNNRMVTALGKTMSLAAWAEEMAITRSALAHRLDRGWTPERALTTPYLKGSRLAV